jgi:hypothetical protein
MYGFAHTSADGFIAIGNKYGAMIAAGSVSEAVRV